MRTNEENEFNAIGAGVMLIIGIAMICFRAAFGQ